MSITYNQILEEMKQAYYNECSEQIKNMSDLEQRFKAVASEIYALSVNADYYLKQAFVQTATGEYLDRHAAMRSIARKTPAYAKGFLTFSLGEALQTDVTIPAKTVCSKADFPLVQFSTDEKAVIKAGDISVTVGATALLQGEEHNALAGEVTVMVNPPEYVISVTNESDFSGGTDQETDESLRQRIMSSYSVISNAVNTKSVEEMILTVDEILDASVAYNTEENLIEICIRLKGAELTTDITSEVSDRLGFTEYCTGSLRFIMAEEKDFSVYAAIKVTKGTDKEQLEKDIIKNITEVCSAKKIGAEISSSRIMTALYGMQGIEFIEISATPSAAGIIPCGSNEYLVLKDVQVDFYE